MACKVCAVGRAISTPDVDRSCRPCRPSSVRRRRSSTLVASSSGTSSSGRPRRPSSWTAREKTQKNIGRDYLVELGKNDTGNTNTNVGARQGVVDDVFTRNATGEFQLGADSDIASGELRYRYQDARKFKNLVGDYHCPPAFMEKVSGHLVKNFLFGGGLRHVREMTNEAGVVVQPPNTPLI